MSFGFARLRRREAQVMAKLTHGAIVPIYDFGEEEGRPFIVMRLMQGGSLKELLQKKGTFSLAEVVSLMERLAPAVDLAHQQNIVHRDLKPDNILLDRQHKPYIADFGIVKLLNASMASKSGTTGTFKYMSPEQASGGKGLDHRSDIYALGVIVFELLTGEHPYAEPGLTPIGFALKHIGDPVPNICQANPKLPAACQAVMARALAKNPPNRYATVTEFTQALKKLLPSAKKPPADAVNFWMEGIEFHKQGAYFKAIAQFSQALQHNTAYVQAYFSRGRAYYQLAEYALAIADYDNCLRIQPHYTAAYYWRGRAKLQINQLEPAIHDFNHALRLNPNYTAPYYWRGQAQHRAGRLTLAIRDYDAALRLQPTHKQAQTARHKAQQEQDAARKREEERKRQEAARKREEERKRQEAARKREEERKRKEEEARKREEERKRQEAARQREEERKRQEAARKREEERKRKQEEARRREEERKRQEAARKREEERKRQEAARQRRPYKSWLLP